MHMTSLTHLNAQGEARMVDVSDKAITQRSATACSSLQMQPSTLALILNNGLPKGDVLASARIAGIMAAKRTPELIPMCHPLLLSKVEVDLQPDHQLPGVRIRATCKLAGQTGVEMEALTAASVAALTLYDMCKAVDKQMIIGHTYVEAKSGGKSGDWQLNQASAAQPVQPPDIAQEAGLLNIYFFAELREQLGQAQLQLSLADIQGTCLADLLQHLKQSHPDWDRHLSHPNLLMAVNQQLAKPSQTLNPKDEVAFFPPVAGG